MATFTRINGYLGNYTTGTLRSTADLKAFVITVRNNSGPIDLQTEDGDVALTEADQLVEQVIRELNPLMYFVPTGSTGAIHVIMHGHNVDADIVERRLKQFLHSNSSVALGTSITVA